MTFLDILFRFLAESLARHLLIANSFMKLSKILNERTQKGQECVELCEQQAFKFCGNLCSFLWSSTNSMWAWKSDRF